MKPYPTNEKCDLYCGRMAELRVLDRKGYEIAVTCRECAPQWQYTYEDADGNVFNP